jgi:hypothetical protein
MTFEIGDRVKWDSNNSTGTIVELGPDRELFSGILWDFRNNDHPTYQSNARLILISTNGYEDFEERIKERMKV